MEFSLPAENGDISSFPSFFYFSPLENTIKSYQAELITQLVTRETCEQWLEVQTPEPACPGVYSVVFHM